MYQKLLIVGNLGRDPDMRFTETGKAVTSFSVAVNRGDEVTWFQVSAWERLAEVCNEYLSKGRRVLVEGRLKPGSDGGPRVWTGKDGVARASFDMVASSVQFLGGKGEGPETGQQRGEQGGGRDLQAEADAILARRQAQQAGAMEAEDIPF